MDDDGDDDDDDDDDNDDYDDDHRSPFGPAAGCHATTTMSEGEKTVRRSGH